MSWLYSIPMVLVVYLLAMCVVLLCSFLKLRQRIRDLDSKEKSLKESLSQKLQMLDLKNVDLEKTNRLLAETRNKLKTIHKELDSHGTEDPLTHLANRTFFEKFLKMEWRRSYRFKRPMALILLEVDYFSGYSEAYGQEASDQCLRKLAATFHRSVNRAGDTVARLDGCEFGIILPETPPDGAFAVAEKLRKRVEALAIPNKFCPQDPFLTISCGAIGMIPATYHGSNLMFEKARETLNRSNEDGHNCVKIDSYS